MQRSKAETSPRPCPSVSARCSLHVTGVTFHDMPPDPKKDPKPPREPPEKSLQEVADELGCYSIEAFAFVQEGLSYAVNKVYGNTIEPNQNRHVSGQQLCEGLREYALARWGLMARAVLARWGITSTFDFGRIVFALIDAQYMSRTDQDSIEDFRSVFDFKTAFDSDYRIPKQST